MLAGVDGPTGGTDPVTHDASFFGDFFLTLSEGAFFAESPLGASVLEAEAEALPESLFAALLYPSLR
jgi:hypothetical protein